MEGTHLWGPDIFRAVLTLPNNTDLDTNSRGVKSSPKGVKKQRRGVKQTSKGVKHHAMVLYVSSNNSLQQLLHVSGFQYPPH